MAHELRGELSDFARLERLDSGSPKTTDLDAPTLDSGGQQAGGLEDTASRASSSAGEQERSPSSEPARLIGIIKTQTELMVDKEDVVTVKYFPLKARAPADASATSCERQDGFEVSSAERQCLSTPQQSVRHDCHPRADN